MAKIMIVEDDEALVKMLEMLFERMGHEVIGSLNGLDALYQVTYHQPDLIVLDLMMPWAAGDAVLGFIRSTQALKRIPVLVLSAHPNGAKIAHQLEADAYLPKPVDMRTLAEYVNRLLTSVSADSGS
ncbi:MAG: response regulator transcription factor [Anaerolineae bacterium]|nr:response regulator transcription factor [Anaerolineae bacterium]